MRNGVYRTIWIILKSIGISFVVFFAINLTTLLLGLIFYGLSETWEFHLKYGVFFLNGREMGLKFLEPAANGLMLLIFIAAFADEVKRLPTDH